MLSFDFVTFSNKKVQKVTIYIYIHIYVICHLDDQRKVKKLNYHLVIKKLLCYGFNL